MIEFLKAYPYLMYVVLIIAQGLTVHLCWRRPIRMVIFTLAVPLMFALVASEVYK